MNQPVNATTVTIRFALLELVTPSSRRRYSILTTGLTNMNATLHVANMVGNIGRLEGGGNAYRFYAEGYTPSLITLTSTMLRRDFRAEGHNLAQLGLAGKTVGEIRSIVQ